MSDGALLPDGSPSAQLNPDQPVARWFRNSKGVIVLAEWRGGAWLFQHITSMGVEATKSDANPNAVDEWFQTAGQQKGFVVMLPPTSVEETKKPKRERATAKTAKPAPTISESHYLYLSTEISKWRRSTWEFYDGPNDPDFRRAFVANFGMTWDEWDAIQLRRGYDDEPGDIREDVITRELRELEAVIAEEAAEEKRLLTKSRQ